jgi:hypothetical protein
VNNFAAMSFESNLRPEHNGPPSPLPRAAARGRGKGKNGTVCPRQRPLRGLALGYCQIVPPGLLSGSLSSRGRGG